MLPRAAIRLSAMLMLTLVSSADTARADDGDYNAVLCERAIINGARRGGVPVEILHAISLTETGRKTGGKLRPWPWAINREGKSHWFDNGQDALDFARRSVAAGRNSFDVGCVQINYRWHGHAFPSLEAMFDPEWTATYAAQFLRTLYEERGSWSEAAGAYHSLTPELAAKYRARFDRLLAQTAPDALSLPQGEFTFRTTALTESSSRARRMARREANRLAQEERRRLAGPPPEPTAGSVGSSMFLPANGSLLNSGTTLLNDSSPLLTAPSAGLFESPSSNANEF
ncbi:lytic transglycosylase domain-containing protein [Amaricoccus tamworthensis]|uniref:lytic transglycosylase domain-containing protein n=1 Tax=Amaricoccus tamworthensis TaxID=57002 RepID=UPI003C7DF96A